MCDFCETKAIMYNLNEEYFWKEIGIEIMKSRDDNTLSVGYVNSPKEKFEINFCPICGRELESSFRRPKKTVEKLEKNLFRGWGVEEGEG
ncbi:hypothetical protein EP56_12580 [Listeriaceae bacterium FSL A5-0209]|nr:hypothetical protein EP56_12580 [Listeriaceae bacterium FSL A5-0209]